MITKYRVDYTYGNMGPEVEEIFDTEEEAEQYILKNIPMFSYEVVLCEKCNNDEDMCDCGDSDLQQLRRELGECKTDEEKKAYLLALFSQGDDK